MDDLWRLGATELAERFRLGTSSAREIVEAHLARIDEVDPLVRAIVRRLDARALADADALDARRANGEDCGPFGGVPFTIKDNIDLAGDPTSQGVSVAAEFTPSADAPIVARMSKAGAIPLARTNLPDLGLRLNTDSQLFGITDNPWRSGFACGGSSGGEGVALATGMSPFGLGNDLGGSLRNPASCCGIASLKPTLGRIPHDSEGPLATTTLMDQVLAVEGPMARRIADLRAGLEVLAGPDPRDPWSVPVDLVATAGPKRIAVVAEPPGGATNPLIADVVRTAANALADAGHQVEEIDVPSYEDAIRCWETLVIGSLINHHDQLAPVLGDNGRTFLEGAMTWYRQNPSRPDLETAWMDRRALAVSFNHFFTEWDAVLTPTWTKLPFPVGFDLTADGPAAVLELIRPVMVANVLGLPSVAVPAGQIDGLPVGVLINGPAWSEMDCLALAEVVEGLAPATPITPQANPPQGS